MRKKMVSGHRGSSLEWELLIHRAASEMQLSTEDETEKKKRKKSCTGRNKCWIIYTNQNIHSNLVSLGLNQLKEASWKTRPGKHSQRQLLRGLSPSLAHMDQRLWTGTCGQKYTRACTCSQKPFGHGVRVARCADRISAVDQNSSTEPVRITAQAVALKM